MDINSMTKVERARYLSGGRVSAKEVFQFEPTVGGGWAPYMRGMRIGEQLFPTKSEAIQYGKEFKARCKRIASGAEVVEE